MRRYDIPIDRTHIIGHSQVPDPAPPGRVRREDHHTDPGPHWKWGYYMNLVRRYAFPERYAIHIDDLVSTGARRSPAIVPWAVRTKGGSAKRRRLPIDGRLLWSDQRKPFAFAGGRGWNTTSSTNGTHVLTVRASGDGRASRRSAWSSASSTTTSR